MRCESVAVQPAARAAMRSATLSAMTQRQAPKGDATSHPKPPRVILANPPHRFRRDPVRFGIIEVWAKHFHGANRGPEAVMRLAFEDASCMAVGSSCGAVEDEGCFSGRHPGMFTFCSY